MPKSAKKKNKKEKESYKRYFLHYIFCLSTVLLLTLTTINIERSIRNQKVLGASIDTSSVQNEKGYWLDIVTKTPSYVDGYLQLAKVDVELGQTTEAESYIVKALQLDPNSTKIPEVQKALGL